LAFRRSPKAGRGGNRQGAEQHQIVTIRIIAHLIGSTPPLAAAARRMGIRASR
jgi:hypothetical protein